VDNTLARAPWGKYLGSGGGQQKCSHRLGGVDQKTSLLRLGGLKTPNYGKHPFHLSYQEIFPTPSCVDEVK
jgi:hypothetical protein